MWWPRGHSGRNSHCTRPLAKVTVKPQKKRFPSQKSQFLQDQVIPLVQFFNLFNPDVLNLQSKHSSQGCLFLESKCSDWYTWRLNLRQNQFKWGSCMLHCSSADSRKWISTHATCCPFVYWTQFAVPWLVCQLGLWKPFALQNVQAVLFPLLY